MEYCVDCGLSQPEDPRVERTRAEIHEAFRRAAAQCVVGPMATPDLNPPRCVHCGSARLVDDYGEDDFYEDWRDFSDYSYDVRDAEDDVPWEVARGIHLYQGGVWSVIDPF